MPQTSPCLSDGAVRKRLAPDGETLPDLAAAYLRPAALLRLTDYQPLSKRLPSAFCCTHAFHQRGHQFRRERNGFRQSLQFTLGGGEFLPSGGGFLIRTP